MDAPALTESLTSEEHEAITSGLVTFNTKRVGYDDAKGLNLVARDESNTIIGGLIGETYWGWLYVDVLWVAEDRRSQGLGRRLLTQAEEEARARGCGNVYLDTFDFQALGFYEKLGYAVFGTLPGFPGTHTRYFLTKTL
jgi:GNAT superfamily N-acetyltransferase